ncbi:MAG: hypothetical protein ACLSA6_01130 [Holdemania massiliensis]
MEFLEGNRKRMAAMIVLVCVYAFLNLCSPLLFSFMIDNVIHQQPAANPVLAWLLESLGELNICSGIYGWAQRRSWRSTP